MYKQLACKMSISIGISTWKAAFEAQRAAPTLGGNHVIASYSLLSSCCSSHSKSDISPQINKINKITSGLFNSRTSRKNPSVNGGAERAAISSQFSFFREPAPFNLRCVSLSKGSCKVL